MSGERKQGRFERALRLTLDLHALVKAGQDESPLADAVRDALDSYWGWCNVERSNDLLTKEQREILDSVAKELGNDE